MVNPSLFAFSGYFVATQVFITFGLAGLILNIVLISLYMCVSSISKNVTLMLLTILCFVTCDTFSSMCQGLKLNYIMSLTFFFFSVVAMLIGILIFGIESPQNPDWSFAMAIIGAVFTLAAGCTSSWQMYNSDVPCPCFNK